MKTKLLWTLVSAVMALGSAPKKMSYELFANLYARLMGGQTAKQLEDELPGLTRKLSIAREVSAAHWTDSTPFDELAKDYVLPEKVMDALGIAHQMTDGVMHTPAGIMHTYGYLFSQLKTSFGLKGKRWIESRIDERLGLKPATFSPLAAKGEFLSNLSVALSSLVGEKLSLAHAAPGLKPTAAVTGFVRQHVKWKKRDGAEVEADVYTHLVELKPLADLKTTDTRLLVYSVVEHGKRRFVTAFPIDDKFAEALIAAKPVSDTTFKPRFNLYVDPTWTVLEHHGDGFMSAKLR